MKDEEILRLYRERSETALTETERQYGALCGTIARNILRNTPEQHWERRAIAAALERFLRGLTPEERILFLRRYWWAEPLKTAAAHCGISPRRARSILERLRRDLRNELEKEEITL